METYHTDRVDLYNRWDLFLSEVNQILIEEFDYTGFLEWVTQEDYKRKLYMGISHSHKGHNGVSVAKIMHAFVCYRDREEGPGNWSWID